MHACNDSNAIDLSEYFRWGKKRADKKISLDLQGCVFVALHFTQFRKNKIATYNTNFRSHRKIYMNKINFSPYHRI